MTATEKTEFVILQEDVKHFKEDFKEHKVETKTELKEIKEIVVEGNKSFDKILSELVGDETTGRAGWFEQTKLNTEGFGRHEIKLSKIEVKMLKVSGFMMAAGLVIGWFMKGIFYRN